MDPISLESFVKICEESTKSAMHDFTTTIGSLSNDDSVKKALYKITCLEKVKDSLLASLIALNAHEPVIQQAVAWHSAIHNSLNEGKIERAYKILQDGIKNVPIK